MNVQPNPTPWVILVVLVMASCAVSGMMLGNVGPFNSHVAEAQIPIQQTQGALDLAATQAAAAISLTQQAPSIQQTAIVAEMTTVPLQQAATQMAVANAIRASEANATQTAIANDLYMQNIASNATATAIAQSQSMERTTGIARFSIIGIGVLILSVWILIRIVTQILVARAQEQTARAKLLEAQRQLVQKRISEQVQRRIARSEYPLPLSLIKKLNGGKSSTLPHGE